MFSIDYPWIIPHLRQLSYGLQPVYMLGEKRFTLIIKAPKEATLTARLNNEFRIYLLGDEAGPESHIGFVTAFFDDHGEPIVLKSPQFAGDALLRDLSQLLGQDEFDLFFFDEQDRELMGVRAYNEAATRFRTEISRATFAEFDRAEFQKTVKRTVKRLDH